MLRPLSSGLLGAHVLSFFSRFDPRAGLSKVSPHSICSPRISVGASVGTHVSATSTAGEPLFPSGVSPRHRGTVSERWGKDDTCLHRRDTTIRCKHTWRRERQTEEGRPGRRMRNTRHAHPQRTSMRHRFSASTRPLPSDYSLCSYRASRPCACGHGSKASSYASSSPQGRWTSQSTASTVDRRARAMPWRSRQR